MLKPFIVMKLPMISCKFEAQSSQVKKPTGIQFLLLSLIDACTTTDMTWEDVMDRMGIPRDMFNILLSEIENLVEQGMTEPGIFNPGLLIRNTKMTSAGKEAFIKKVIAYKPHPINGEILFVPGRNNKYVLRENAPAACSHDEFDIETFSNTEPDLNRAEDVLIEKKKEFMVKLDEQIFDINFNVQDVECYSEKIFFEFDSVLGNFRVSYDPNRDFTYIRSCINVGGIMNNINTNLFQIPSSNLKVLQWMQYKDEGASSKFILPCEMDIGSSAFVFVNSDICTFSGHHYETSTISGMMVSYKNGKIMEYKFIEKITGFEGIEGEAKIKCIMCTNVDENKLGAVVSDVLVSIPEKGFDSLKSALELLALIKDKEGIVERVEGFLRSSPDLKTDIGNLVIFGKESWYKNEMSSLVEKILCDKKDINIDMIGEILTGTKTRIQGPSIAKLLKTGNSVEDMHIADVLFLQSENKIGIVDSLKISETMSNFILKGEDGAFKSKEFNALSNASKNLKEAMAVLNMDSTGWSVDFSSLKDVEIGRLRSANTALDGSMKDLKPIIGNTVAFRTLEERSSIIKTLSDSMKGDSPRMRGIELGIRLETMLSELVGKMDLHDMIVSAHEKELISEGTYIALEEFREFRNVCAHEVNVKNPDKNKMKKWKHEIESLETTSEAQETKK